MSSPTADVSVRVAWADDAPAIAAVQVAAYRKAYDGVAPAEQLAALDESQIAGAWHHSLTRPGDARNRVLVALERNRVVGFAITAPAADPDADPINDGEIREFTVLPSERGQGHGSRLLQACADTLAADRFSRATTWVFANDDTFRAFLTSAGWAPDGAHRELTTDGPADDPEIVKQVRLHTSLS